MLRAITVPDATREHLAHRVGCACDACEVIRDLGPQLAAPTWPRLAGRADVAPWTAETPTAARARMADARRAARRAVRARLRTAPRRAGTIAWAIRALPLSARAA